MHKSTFTYYLVTTSLSFWATLFRCLVWHGGCFGHMLTNIQLFHFDGVVAKTWRPHYKGSFLGCRRSIFKNWEETLRASTTWWGLGQSHLASVSCMWSRGVGSFYRVRSTTTPILRAPCGPTSITISWSSHDYSLKPHWHRSISTRYLQTH